MAQAAEESGEKAGFVLSPQLHHPLGDAARSVSIHEETKVKDPKITISWKQKGQGHTNGLHQSHLLLPGEELRYNLVCSVFYSKLPTPSA